MRPDPSGLAHSASPVDLPEPPEPLVEPLRWTTVVILVAALTLGLLNAHALRGWSYQLTPAPFSARIVDAAEAWHAAMDRAGLNRPGAVLRGWWQSARERRFDPQPAPEPSSSRQARA